MAAARAVLLVAAVVLAGRRTCARAPCCAAPAMPCACKLAAPPSHAPSAVRLNLLQTAWLPPPTTHPSTAQNRSQPRLGRGPWPAATRQGQGQDKPRASGHGVQRDVHPASGAAVRAGVCRAAGARAAQDAAVFQAQAPAGGAAGGHHACPHRPHLRVRRGHADLGPAAAAGARGLARFGRAARPAPRAPRPLPAPAPSAARTPRPNLRACRMSEQPLARPSPRPPKPRGRPPNPRKQAKPKPPKQPRRSTSSWTSPLSRRSPPSASPPSPRPTRCLCLPRRPPWPTWSIPLSPSCRAPCPPPCR